MRAQSMRTRKVDQLYRLLICFQGTDVPLYGDTRIIADALPEPCQAIKKSALARIWTTDNRNAGIRLPAYGNIG